MRQHSLVFRLTSSVAVTALLLSPVLSNPALAQMGPAVVAASQQQAGDPPARVGRLAAATGSVSFHSAEADQWSPAQPNYPVTSGDAFWTQPDAQAELQVSASSINLAGATEFVVDLLDANGLQATQGAGEAYLHLRGLRPNEAWSVQTPRGLVTFSGDGRYAIVAGDTQTPTTVTVLDGGAQVTGRGLNLQVGPGQAAVITGAETFQGNIVAAQPDAFVTAMLARERPPRPAVAPPATVEMMPGGADLAAYGTWAEAPAYGPVWYPRVAPGWVPYRYGHWVWVFPWGWTWVDDDPWGFAPFHYGRWVLIGSSWAWTPGVVLVTEPPVYAPALVTFFGVAAGVAIGAALTSGRIGWCPLGPHEAYHPWYHASDRYWREVNIHNVRNITTINRTVALDRYVNRSAATVVPVSVLQASRPVRGAAIRVDPRELTRARPVIGHDPVAPSRATLGVTAATARQTRLAPVPSGAAVRHAPAPGPAFRPATMPGAARPQGHVQPARPPLRAPQLRGQPSPQVRPVAPTGRVTPSTVAPGGRPTGAQPGRAPPPQTRPGAPSGAAVTPHAPPLLRPGERPAATPATRGYAPQAPHSPSPRYQAPTVRPVPQARPAQPRPSAAPRVEQPSRPAPTYRAPAAPQQYHPPAQATPRVYQPSAPRPQYRPPAQATPHYQPQAAPRYQPPAQVTPQPRPAPQFHSAPQPRPAPQFHPAPQPRPAPQYHPAPQPQMRAAPPRPAPSQQQDQKKRPG